MARTDDEIEVWGDGEQTRSFLYIDQCVEGTVRLLRSDFPGPINIGSEEMVTINQLVDLVAEIAGKRIQKRHIPGPQGVRGRNSDNRLARQKLLWEPTQSLRTGLELTYKWVEQPGRQEFTLRHDHPTPGTLPSIEAYAAGPSPQMLVSEPRPNPTKSRQASTQNSSR